MIDGYTPNRFSWMVCTTYKKIPRAILLFDSICDHELHFQCMLQCDLLYMSCIYREPRIQLIHWIVTALCSLCWTLINIIQLNYVGENVGDSRIQPEKTQLCKFCCVLHANKTIDLSIIRLRKSKYSNRTVTETTLSMTMKDIYQNIMLRIPLVW